MSAPSGPLAHHPSLNVSLRASGTQFGLYLTYFVIVILASVSCR